MTPSARQFFSSLALGLLTTGLTTGAAPAFAADSGTTESVLAKFKDEPSVQDVQGMVLEYSKTDNHYVQNWLAASKDAGWLPTFEVDYGYDNGYTESFDYADGTVSSELLSSSGISLKNSVTAKVKWDFSKAVMSSNTIRVISDTQSIVKLRDKILDETTRLYFDRRRLQVDMLLNEGDAKTQMKNELRLEELTAQIDAYTGGLFTKALDRKK